MKEDFQEVEEVKKALQLLKQQRHQVFQDQGREAWKRQLQQELRLLFEELGAAEQEIQTSLRTVEKEAADPVARLEQLVAQARVIRNLGALGEVREEMGLSDEGATN